MKGYVQVQYSYDLKLHLCEIWTRDIVIWSGGLTAQPPRHQKRVKRQANKRLCKKKTDQTDYTVTTAYNIQV